MYNNPSDSPGELGVSKSMECDTYINILHLITPVRFMPSRLSLKLNKNRQQTWVDHARVTTVCSNDCSVIHQTYLLFFCITLPRQQQQNTITVNCQNIMYHLIKSTAITTFRFAPCALRHPDAIEALFTSTAPSGLQGCKNRPVPFPGRMS